MPFTAEQRKAYDAKRRAKTNTSLGGVVPEPARFRDEYVLQETDMKSLKDFPLFGQLNNRIDPYDTCNMTSLAMCLHFYGLRGNGVGQIEDQLSTYQKAKGLNRGSPTDIAFIANVFGAKLTPQVTDTFDPGASLEQIHDSIDAGNPVIVHGYFTRSGHIVVVTGYSATHVQLHDPYGEWYETGYDTNQTGSIYNLSNATFTRICEDEVWAHFFHRN